MVRLKILDGDVIMVLLTSQCLCSSEIQVEAFRQSAKIWKLTFKYLNNSKIRIYI